MFFQKKPVFALVISFALVLFFGLVYPEPLSPTGYCWTPGQCPPMECELCTGAGGTCYTEPTCGGQSGGGGPVCGDSVCQAAESCSTCPQDCGQCAGGGGAGGGGAGGGGGGGGGVVGGNGTGIVSVPKSCNNNFICETNETTLSCPKDCEELAKIDGEIRQCVVTSRGTFVGNNVGLLGIPINSKTCSIGTQAGIVDYCVCVHQDPYFGKCYRYAYQKSGKSCRLGDQPIRSWGECNGSSYNPPCPAPVGWTECPSPLKSLLVLKKNYPSACKIETPACLPDPKSNPPFTPEQVQSCEALGCKIGRVKTSNPVVCSENFFCVCDIPKWYCDQSANCLNAVNDPEAKKMLVIDGKITLNRPDAKYLKSEEMSYTISGTYKRPLVQAPMQIETEIDGAGKYLTTITDCGCCTDYILGRQSSQTASFRIDSIKPPVKQGPGGVSLQPETALPAIAVFENAFQLLASLIGGIQK